MKTEKKATMQLTFTSAYTEDALRKMRRLASFPRLVKATRYCRFLIMLIMVMAGLSVSGQQYHNEWINHAQTYYKFKVGKSGVYRISKTTLDAAGIGNSDAQYFELWKNGDRVPMYSTTSSGPLGSDGYLEFWGEGNDGRPDTELYRNPAFQHSKAISLLTDTSVYFLTVNTSQTGFRYNNPGNDVAGNTLPVQPYYIHTAATYYRNKINAGLAVVVGEYVYSSSYDKGEFWSSNPIRPTTPLTTTHNALNPFPGGPDAVLRFGAMGDALNERHLKVSVNGTVLKDTIMDLFTDVHTSATVPAALIGAGSAAVKFENTSPVSTDRLVISYLELDYPRPFNFGNQKNFKFRLPATGTGYFLNITNFNAGGTPPVLLDITTGQRIVTNTGTPGTIRVVIPPGGDREFVLVNAEVSNTIAVTDLVSKTFIDYSLTSNQGDYLIITNKVLFSGPNGSNPVEEYKNYRGSPVGGGYDPLIVDIDELVDQFAFGIKKSPLSVKNFLRYARASFSSTPQYVFIIGRGVCYNDFRTRESIAAAEQLNLVPTFGSPGSDNMLSSPTSADPVAATPIGRLSVVHSSEISDYLEKIKEYEAVQKNATSTLADREWMKNVLHVTGSSDPFLGTVLCNYMGVYRQIIQDTMFGGRVVSFCKASTNTVEQINNEKIAQLFQEGISVLTYFGHSSTSTLEFNIENPQTYNNQGKYPVFFVNGCNAGNFFTYNTTRLLVNETLSESFVLAKKKGGIAFVASTHFGIVNYLNIYMNNLYKLISSKDYHQTLGITMRDALQRMMTVAGPNDFYARVHAEEITMHGDPAIYLNGQAKPDYVIEESQVKINPSFISVAEDDFEVKIRMVNIGMSLDDSIYLDVKRQYPNGVVETVLRKKIRGIRYADSLTLNLPIVASRDNGASKITVTIDADNVVDEISESNNSITKDVFIFEDEARAVYPYDYSIVNTPGQKLYASTADPFSLKKDYLMEIDTTALFNSSIKMSKTLSATEGLLEFDPGFSYVDSTVYYWRVSSVPTAGGSYRWSNSSFIFINGPNDGFNQSHFFQQLSSDQERLTLNADRKWGYNSINNNLFVRLGTWLSSAAQESSMSVSINSKSPMIHNTCNFSALAFVVFDPVTFKPWRNEIDPGTGKGLYKSERNDCYAGRLYNFEFKYGDSASRNNAVNFMKNVIPDGAYVLVRAFVADPVHYPTMPQAFIGDWMKDTLRYGSNNSLYHSLYGQGFTELDSFYRLRPWIFAYKKNEQDVFFPKSVVAKGTFDNITMSVDCKTPDTVGFITSPRFGPAREWKEVIWKGTSMEASSADNPVVSVIGIDEAGVESVLFHLDKDNQHMDISAINAAQYPYMKLKMRNIDSVTLTPYQLDYWRIHYLPVTEGSIASNLFLSSKDTLEVGEPFQFGIAFKNVSKYDFDSLSVKMTILDEKNITHTIELPRQKPLISGDTIIFKYHIDTREFSGSNTIYLEFNPDKDQPEQHQFNNFLYKNFYVKTDYINPILDVTFDGVHILNRDLVSARPHIQIRLKDEAKYLLLNDTALSSVQVRYPDGSVRTHHFDNDTLRFTPAVGSQDNTAVVDFYPHFTGQSSAEGDEYELIVKGRDRSGNKSGESEYRVAFTVISKPMISNLLNYPNPFSTSTAFVFTLTGSEVPQNLKIQILTITGKIVREITKQELGPIHIGRNITEFKWDGTDQFGQKLANGVYLYRFVATLNGSRMEKYKAQGDTTDKFFNNGYGKMYLMR